MTSTNTNTNAVRAYGRADFTGDGVTTIFIIAIPAQSTAAYVPLVTLLDPTGSLGNLSLWGVLLTTAAQIRIKFLTAPTIGENFSFLWAVLR